MLVADRFGSGRSSVHGRSVCDHCGETLAARDLVPIGSWLMLSRKSRCCGKTLPWRYPLVELTALVLAVWAVWVSPPGIALLGALLGWWLLALSLIDLRCLRLPDTGTLPLMLFGLGVSAAGLTGPLLVHLLGAGIGYTALAGIGWAYRRFRGIDALGLGDAKLLAAAGAWLGAHALPSVLIWACLSGLAFAVLRGWRSGLSMSTAIPFGPFLALGFWMGWLYGPINFY